MSKLWGGLPPDFSQNRHTPNPLLPLVRELRDFVAVWVEEHECGCPPEGHVCGLPRARALLTRADKLLAEPQEGNL